MSAMLQYDNEECVECLAEVKIPGDYMEGELVPCPDCGQDYEIKTEDGMPTLYKLEIKEKEDWGE